MDGDRRRIDGPAILPFGEALTQPGFASQLFSVGGSVSPLPGGIARAKRILKYPEPASRSKVATRSLLLFQETSPAGHG